MQAPIRAIVVGASTLLGRELVEELNASSTPWELRLADAVDAPSQIVPGGGEALLIQPLTPELFDGIDVAFFASGSKTTRAHWKEAQTAGAAIVDLSAALEAQPQAVVRCPWMPNAATVKTRAPLVIPAHPAAAMLGIVAARLGSAFPGVHLAATVLEPASQQGSRGLDELHQQTMGLLGLRPLPQDVYDAQVAFNLRLSLGPDATLDIGEVAATIRRHMRAVADSSITSSIAVQLVQAPVFHGYAISVYVKLPANTPSDAVRRALAGGPVTVHEAAVEPPTNQSVMQQPGIAIAVRSAEDSVEEAESFWLWIAADNLKLTAREAIACADDLLASSSGGPQ
jgi:aspartate-semialdehyde dehydrogenase